MIWNKIKSREWGNYEMVIQEKREREKKNIKKYNSLIFTWDGKASKIINNKKLCITEKMPAINGMVFKGFKSGKPIEVIPASRTAEAKKANAEV